MSIHTRFFGQREADDAPDALVGGKKTDNAPALQVLLADAAALDPDAITEALRRWHPSLAQARCEVAGELNEERKLFGLAGWGPHVLQLVGFDVPMPAGAVEACVAPSHYGPDLKDQARAHRSHLLLWYVGRAKSVVEQYVALTAFAAVLAEFGAVVVLNEDARTSFPAAALTGQDEEADRLDLLRTLPLPILYCGFVKYNVPNDTRVWMRTYGGHVLGVPDLAVYAAGHHEGERYFSMFDAILRYMLDSGKLLAAGHTMQVGADDYLRCRAPRPDETWLESKGDVLLVEIIRADQVNKPRKR